VFEYAAKVASPEKGAYSMVARATESVVFTGHASVAELWASLPTFPTPPEHLGHRPRCLYLELANTPGDNRPLFQRVFGRTHVAFRFTPPPLDELSGVYPELSGILEDGSRVNVFGGEEPLFRFEFEDGTPRPASNVGTLSPGADSSLGDRVVRPKIGDASLGPPSEFLTFYTLLFCLSELARYYPDTWVRALDPDASTAAVTLERGLDIALARAAPVISAALRGPIDRLIAAELRRMRADAAAVSGEATAEQAEAAPDAQ
jgi:hypothetical protein